MYFLISLFRQVPLPPQQLGPTYKQHIIARLSQEYEGQCSARYGYIIAIVNVVDVGKARLSEVTGNANFPVHFQAVVFKPFRGEVLDSTVVEVTPWGFIAEIGPLKVFVSKHNLPSHLHYVDDGQSQHRFAAISHTEESSSAGTDATVIEEGARIRLKIINTRSTADGIDTVGTIAEDFLGQIEVM